MKKQDKNKLLVCQFCGSQIGNKKLELINGEIVDACDDCEEQLYFEGMTK